MQPKPKRANALDFGRDAIDTLGLPPFAQVMPAGSTTSSLIDPALIAQEVFHRRFDLSDRASALAALESVLPMTVDDSGKSVVTSSPAEAQINLDRKLRPLYGQMGAAAASLQALSNHASTIDQIKPIGCSTETGGCGHEPIVILIRDAIADMVGQFATGQPLASQVDGDLAALVGDFKVVKTEADVQGYVGRLRDRCRLKIENVCSDHDAAIYTNFVTLFSLTNSFAAAWVAATASTVKFAGTQLLQLQRLLSAIVGTLTRWRQAVPDADWAIADFGTKESPIAAGQFWRSMYQFSARTAPEMLNSAGLDARFAINQAMSRFHETLGTVLKPGLTPCSKTFSDEAVQAIVKELDCYVGRVVDEFKPADGDPCDPATTTTSS